MVYVINEDEVEKRKKELKYFRGFVPFQFDGFISLSERKKFLESVGLWKTVHEKELEVMQGIRDSKPNDAVYLDAILDEWLEMNPQFKDLVL